MLRTISTTSLLFCLLLKGYIDSTAGAFNWLNVTTCSFSHIISGLPSGHLILLNENKTEAFATQILERRGNDYRTHLYINFDLITVYNWTTLIKEYANSNSGIYLNYIVFLEEENLYTTIKNINYIDKNSKKSTNIRHWSTWIIFHHLTEYHTLENLVTKFDNMALVRLCEKDGEDTCTNPDDVITLVMSPNGSVFTPIDTSHHFVLFPNMAFGYNGRHLDVLTKSWPPLIDEKDANGTKIFVGYIADIMEYISQYLNFTYSIYNDKESTWSGLVNGTWEGMFLKMKNGEFDISCSPSSVQDWRLEVVDYAFPSYLYDSTHAIYKQESPVPSYGISGSPFQLIVSVLILVTCIVCCGMLWFLGKVNPVQQHGENPNTIHGIVFYVIGVALNQGITMRAYSHKSRIFIAAFWSLSIVIGAVYRANLVSILTASKTVVPFNSMEEMISSSYTLGAIANTSLLHILQNDKVPIYRKLYQELVKDGHLTKERRTQTENVLQGKYVFFTEMISTADFYSQHCDVVRFESSLYTVMYTLSTPKHSPIRHDLERVMRYLDASGILNRLLQKWMPDGKQGFCDDSVKTKQLHLADIYGVFIIPSCCVVVCCFVLCMERMYVTVMKAIMRTPRR